MGHRYILCFSVCLLMGLSMGTAFARGGTNRIFDRMGFWVNQLAEDKALTPEAIEYWHDEIARLRQKVDDRMKEKHTGLNPIHDKDLYDEIDVSNKALYEFYKTHEKE